MHNAPGNAAKDIIAIDLLTTWVRCIFAGFPYPKEE
jgi:hypothetical protein